MSGKKTKKAKWKALNVGQLLPDTSVSLSKPSWSDHQDDDRGSFRKHVLPTAPRAVRGSDDERVPKEPPYLAFLSNLPYEITEEEITEHFAELEIVNVRLPRRDKYARGFGYVEFQGRNGLLEALSKSDLYMKGRTIRIDVAQEGEKGPNRMRDRDRDMDRDRDGDRDRDRDRMGDDDPDRTLGDWRSSRAEAGGDDRGGRPAPRREYSSGFRDDRDGGGFGGRDGGRDGDSREGGWRDSAGGGSDRFPPARDRFGERRGFGDRDRDRDFERGRGFGDRDGDRGDRDRGRFGDRDRDRDRDYPPRRGYQDDRRDDDGGRDGGAPSEPRTRPKILLEPRKVPLDPPPAAPASADGEAESSAPPRTSIFGAAKPVDTAAREREIEERLAKQKSRGRSPDGGGRGRSPEGGGRGRSPEGGGRGRSPEGGDRGSDERPKRVDAPPPKENAWSRRQAGATDNGVSTPHDSEADRPSSPHNSQDGGDSHSYRDSDSNRGGSYRDTDSYRDSDSYRNSESRGYRDSDDRSRSGYRDGEGRAGYRDSSRGNQDYRDSDRDRGRNRGDYRSGDRNADRSGDRNADRSGDRKADRNADRSGDRNADRSGDRGSGRSGYRDSDRDGRSYRDDRSNHSSPERGPSSKDGDSSSRKDDRPLASERPQRSRDHDDPSRMPKYKEEEAPNFAGSNKFSQLEDKDDY